MSKIRKGLANPRAAMEYVGTRSLWWFWRRHQVTNIYDREWDVVVVLDACRYDLFEEVGWDRPQSVEPIYSVASMTGDWMERTFPRDASDTVYVTSAPFSEQKLDSERFADLDEVWRYGFDEDIGTVPPALTTDRGIIHSRNSDADRLVVHYMQPHFPSIEHPELGSKLNPEGSARWNSVWERYYEGDISYDLLWNAYRSNLVTVLEHVDTLLDNLDAERVVVTSDHGNALGKAGRYGHPSDAVVPSVRRVPWAVIGPTSDRRSRVPPDERRDLSGGDGTTDDTKEKLAALGYY